MRTLAFAAVIPCVLVALLLFRVADEPSTTALVTARVSQAKVDSKRTPRLQAPIRAAGALVPKLGDSWQLAVVNDPPVTGDELTATLAAQREERQRHRERIRQALQSQSRDTEWAQRVETEVRSSMNLARDSARFESVECRRTLCELVMSHPHPDAQREAMTAFAGAPGFQLAGTAHLEHEPSGTPTTFVYLARDEERFPIR